MWLKKRDLTLVIKEEKCLADTLTLLLFSHSIVSWVFATSWTAARQASLSFTIYQSCWNSCPLSQWYHLVLYCPLLLLLSILPSIRVFSNESVYLTGDQSIGASASTSVLPINIQDWFSLGWTGSISLQSKKLSRVFSNTTVQKHQFFCAQHSLQSNSHIHTWPLEKP